MRTLLSRINRAIAPTLATLAPFLKVAKNAADHLPHDEDGPFAVAVKVLAIADVVREGLRADAGYWRTIREDRGLEQRESETFVKLFFGTALRGAFPTRRKTIDERTELVEVDIGSGASLIFRERTWGDQPSMSDEFLVTPGADLLGVIEQLWAAYPRGIYLSIDTNEYGYGRVTTVAEVASPKIAYLSGKARDLLALTTRTQAALALAQKHRTYLLYGEPGTGKSSFADGLARMSGGRVLQLDSSALAHVGVKELAMLVNTLQPSALILNDIDSVDVEKVKARLLYLFESFKGSCVDVPLIVTANDPSTLPRALFRPRRIEKPIRFQLPDAEERLELIKTLAGIYGIELDDESVRALVAKTDGLAHAFVDHLVESLRFESPDVVLSDMLELRGLAAPAASTAVVGDHPVG